MLATPPTDAFASDIWRLQLFKWHNWRPLALLWYSDYRRALRQGGPGAAQKMAAAQRRFAALHRRCMAISLAGFSHVDREKIFGRAISQVNRDINPLSSAGALAFNPQQTARIRETLRVPMMDKDIRVMLVRWLESMAHADVVPIFVRDTTVEHVLPRRPGDGTQWTVDFRDPEARFLSCHALGNLAGIDKQRNEILKNAEFALKQPIYVAAAAEYATLIDVAAAGQWTQIEIESRTERLAVDIERHLDLPPPFTRPLA